MKTANEVPCQSRHMMMSWKHAQKTLQGKLGWEKVMLTSMFMISSCIS